MVAITAQLTSHYRKTLDEPIPILKGLIPRQCAADPTLHDDDTEPSEVAEWGAFGFLYTVASLSFDDARPRGYSENDFLPKDEFTVGDFFECLSYKSGELHLMADYVRGRCMKTDITVRPDGTTTLRELNLT